MAHSETAVRVLLALVEDPEQPGAVRVRAAAEILDRAGIRPPDDSDKAAVNLTFLQQIVAATRDPAPEVRREGALMLLPVPRQEVVDVEPSPLPAATQSGRAEPLPTRPSQSLEARLVSPEAAEAARRWRAIVEARRGGKR